MRTLLDVPRSAVMVTGWGIDDLDVLLLPVANFSAEDEAEDRRWRRFEEAGDEDEEWE
ncbi:hypothetical protein VFPBJ_11705 [Purpureocillium lilacinum]|uniref:Uncharacterized protein n=1 Tax=Purpureocillium lilacinum TaxID=33203 RepID=A0A179EYT2_PURLI|nr:hypothetical protein VFPBJ_11705 [Purpureocillium lilacinum]